MNALAKILSTLLPIVISSLSPEIRKLLEKTLKDLYANAKTTSNPFDDMAIQILAALVGVDL